MIGIYKITNKNNGKSYIGQSIHCGKRLDEHCKGSQLIDQIIQIEGIENFNFEILKEVEKSDLSYWEDYYIMMYNTMFPNGYNQKWNCNKETRRKIKQTLKTSNKNSIYVQTQTKDNYLSDKKITSKQWKIYYYMLGVSKVDNQKQDIRYIYKNNLNVTQVCHDLGIKSTQTFYNAISKLEEHGLLNDNHNYYYLYTNNCVEIDKEILINLIKYSKNKEKDIDLLRTFLILKKLDNIAETIEERNFTLRQICILLGHGDTTEKYYRNIKFYLALLSFWGLIELKQHKTYNEQLNVIYTIYHLQSVKENNLNDDFVLNIEEEANSLLPSEKLMNKLRFCYPELIEK